MKKRVLILAAALLCLLSTGVLAAGGTSQKVDLWNGNASMPTSIVSQDGEQYYEISSCSELAYVAQMGGSWLKQNYRLVADLDLDGRSWTPIGTETTPYTGIFDGNGHCISGLHIATARSQSGLFGAVQNAEIFGLELKDASIQFSGNQEDLYAGLLTGMTDETVSIHDCKVAGSIAITTSSTDFLHVGGLIGQTYSFQSYGAPTITNSAGWGDVSSNQYAGGLIGYQKSTLDTVENCYRNRGATVSGPYRNSTGYSMQEEDLCIVDFVENTLFWDLDQVWELSPSVNDGYPSLRLFASDTHTEQLRINSITVRDTDGSTLAVIPEDDFLATVSITNLTAESDLLVLLAAYTEEGQYQGILWVSVEDLTPGATIKVTVPVENPSGRITNLKAFVVNSFADPTPMGTVISFLP